MFDSLFSDGGFAWVKSCEVYDGIDLPLGY